MSLILKLVVLLLIFSFVVYVLKAIARFSQHLRRIKTEIQQIRTPATGGGPVSAEMVRCSTCGTFVASKDSVQLRVRNKSQTFCSEVCLKKQQSGS